MRILVIGSGGREHALAWKIAQSKLCDKLFCAPGNGGISRVAECVGIAHDDVSGLLEFAVKERIDLTVVGPEQALAAGIVDEFERAGKKIFGPHKSAAQLEASKVFSKELMAKYNVPTAGFKVFDDPEEAKRYIRKNGVPCVVKADGLAAGKGVVVAQTVAEAEEAVASMMQKKVFGDAGKRVIIEECLSGQEASILVVTDSRHALPLASAQDHKRVFDGDRGGNTGGMGAYSPAPAVTEAVLKEIMDTVVCRTIRGLSEEGIAYRGVLYAGIMLTPQGPRVLEFNVRFGDPETQAILPRLKTDLVEIMLATCSGRLSDIGTLKWDSRACVCVVCTSGGYPGPYTRDKEITGLDDAEALEGVVVFHAGTVLRGETGHYLTSGGRVLGVTGMGATIKEAIKETYNAVSKISFEGMHYRKDIGRRALDL